MAFGRRDTRLPGFPDAVAVARDAGFTPAVRATGGRAVAYTDAALVVDQVAAEANPTHGHDRRFEEFGGRFVAAFRGLRIDARLGAVPGEYCPGAHSVNARATVKLVGTAQRVVRGAWLFSSLVVLGDDDVIRPVLDRVYRALGQEFDPGCVGSLASEGIDEQTAYDAIAARFPPTMTEVDAATLAAAHTLLPDHAASRP